MDQMIDLYHRTTPQAALSIMRVRGFISKENPKWIYFTDNMNGEHSQSYGSSVVHVRVPIALAELDDSFDLEAHYRVMGYNVQGKAIRGIILE
jgi:hypothetical protein